MLSLVRLIEENFKVYRAIFFYSLIGNMLSFNIPPYFHGILVAGDRGLDELKTPTTLNFFQFLKP